MADKAEVVDATVTDVVLYDTKLFPELRWQDPAEIGRKAASRIGMAKSSDELFDVFGGQSASQLIGRRLEIHDVDFVAYQSDQGIVPNGICSAVDIDNGEVLQFAVTSIVCTAQLRRAQLAGWLPWKVKIAEKLTTNNQKALNFERP
jgi:hypothetical protein